MTEGKSAICYRSRTEECARQAAYRQAEAALTNPCAREALTLFDKVFSQWNATMGERYGLDYGVLWEWADRYGFDADAETMEYVQVLETEQLAAWRKPGP